MYEVKSIVRPERVSDVVLALHQIPGLPGVTVSNVRGIGRRSRSPGTDGPEFGETEMVKLETVIPAGLLAEVLEAVQRAAHTGRGGDGKVFVSEVAGCVSIRNGQRGVEAL